MPEISAVYLDQYSVDVALSVAESEYVISGYGVNFTLKGTDKSVEEYTSSASHTFTIDGLTPGTSYTFIGYTFSFELKSQGSEARETTGKGARLLLFLTSRETPKSG